MVVLRNREHIQELFRAPDVVLSMKEATNEVRNFPVLPELCRVQCRWQRLNMHYALGHEILGTDHHIVVVRSQLTRNIARLYPEIRDEIVTAFDEVLDLRGHGEDSAFMKVAIH